MPLGPGQICSPSVFEDRPSVKCVCDCDGGGWFVVCCLGQHLFTHSLTVWDDKQLHWMNQSAVRLMTPGLWTCTYYSRSERCNQTHVGRQYTSTHSVLADLFFSAFRQMKWLACLLPFVNPLSRLLLYMKQSGDYCFEITNAVSHYMKETENSSPNAVPPAVCQILGNPFVYVCRNTQTVE